MVYREKHACGCTAEFKCFGGPAPSDWLSGWRREVRQTKCYWHDLPLVFRFAIMSVVGGGLGFTLASILVLLEVV